MQTNKVRFFRNDKDEILFLAHGDSGWSGKGWTLFQLAYESALHH